MEFKLGVHETLELHEILTYKNLCLTKATAMRPLAQDEDLKRILETEAKHSSESIEVLLHFIKE
ncbi:MAG: spore coat protein [Bacillales bacterium]|jgi:similar to spore coat protein|nr:spore coat protein [Bacillales bacterium]